MDALSVQETNKTLPYRSLNEGKMHACGHDGHMAMLLGAAKYLSENNIETKIQHPLLMSQQKPYLNCVSQSPNALRIVNRILCLPIHESLEQDDVDYVIEKVTEFFR